MLVRNLMNFVACFTLVLLILVLNIETGYCQSLKSKACSWSGTWKTSLGNLELTHNGDKVTGKFIDNKGDFQGIVSGRYIIGAWSVSDNYHKGPVDGGNLNLIMSEDCNSFSGDSKSGFDQHGGNWNFEVLSGKRKNTVSTNNSPYQNNNHTESITNKDYKIYTKEVLEQSPSPYELEYSSVLYTKAINNYSEEGKQFAQIHSQLSSLTIELIKGFQEKLNTTRQANEGYNQLIYIHFAIWKILADEIPELKPIYDREVQVFNITLDYDLREKTHWAEIDALNEEIKRIEASDNTPVNESLTKANLYNQLLVAYINLIDLYQEKYQYLFTISTFNHAAIRATQLNLPAEIQELVTPIHQLEFEIAGGLLYDLENLIDGVNAISDIAVEYNNLYKEIDRYSLTQLDSLIQNLDQEKAGIQSDLLNTSDIERKEIITSSLSLLNNYIELYKDYKNTLNNKILSREITETTITSLEKENIKLAYIGPINSKLLFSGFGSKILESLKFGANTIVGGGFAMADYLTGKASDLAFEATEKSKVAWNHGLFSKEYKEFSDNYNHMHKKMNKNNIDEVFTRPMLRELQGDSKSGLGQRGIGKIQQSFQSLETQTDKYTSSNLITNVAFNIVTVGGYGLAKDVTTIKDAKASQEEIVGSSVGILLAVLPAHNAAEATKSSTKLGSNILKNGKEAAEEIIEAGTKKTATKSVLKESEKNLVKYTDDYCKTLTNPNIKPSDLSYKQASRNLDNYIYKNTIVKKAYDQAQKNVSETIQKNIIKVPTTTLKDVFSTTGDIAKGILYKYGIDGFSDMCNKSITEVIKNSGGLKYYLTENFINNLAGGLITNKVKEYVNSVASIQPQNIAIPPQTTTNNNSGAAIGLIAQYLNSLGTDNTLPDQNTYNQLINSLQANQQSYNQNRQNNNTGNTSRIAQNSNQQFDTGFSQSSTISHVQNLSKQTQTPVHTTNNNSNQNNFYDKSIGKNIGISNQSQSSKNTGSCNWTGTWNTKFGLGSKVVLTQSGNNITGYFITKNNKSQGKITATAVSAYTIRGKWSQPPTFNPPKDAGDITFQLSGSCNKFEGKWSARGIAHPGVWIGERTPSTNNVSNQSNIQKNNSDNYDPQALHQRLLNAGKTNQQQNTSSCSYAGTWDLTAKGLGPLVITGSSSSGYKITDSSGSKKFVSETLSKIPGCLRAYYCSPTASDCGALKAQQMIELRISTDCNYISGSMSARLRELIPNSWHNFRGTRK